MSKDHQWLAPDGVLHYLSSILNDGILVLGIRDVIHEGDGPRIIMLENHDDIF